MSRQPIVKIYHLTYRKGAKGGIKEEVISPLTYKGSNVGEQFLHMFKYTYVASGHDTGTLALMFPFTNINLGLLNKGTYLHIEWGYVGSPLNYRQVAIEDLSLRYDQSGCRLNLELISVAGFLDKNPSWEPSIGGMLEEKSMRFIYTFNNPIDNTVQTYTFEPNSGRDGETSLTMHGVHNPSRAREPRKANNFFQRLYQTVDNFVNTEAEKEAARLEAQRNQVYRRKTATELQVGMTGGFTVYNKAYSQQRISEAVMGWLVKHAARPSVATRDRDLRALEGLLDESPVITFSLKPSPNSVGVINISVEQPSSPYEVGVDNVLQVDPNTKKVLCHTFRMVEDSSEEISESVGHMFIRVTELENNVEVENVVKIPVVLYRDEPFLHYGDEIVRLTLKQQEEFNLVKKMRSHYGDEAFDKSGFLKSEMVDRYNSDLEKQGRIDFIRFAYPQMGALTRTQAQELMGDRKQNPGEYAKAHSTFRIDTRGPEAAQATRNELLHEYFSQIGCKVTVEGNSFIEMGFNFSVINCASYLDGIYFCVESEHQIMKGSYRTIVSGARVPSSIHMQSFVNEASPNLKEIYADQISEHYKVIEEAQKAVAFSSLSSSDIGFDGITSMWMDLSGIGYQEAEIYHMDNFMRRLKGIQVDGRPLIPMTAIDVQDSSPVNFPNIVDDE